MWLRLGNIDTTVIRAEEHELRWVAEYLTFEDSSTRWSTAVRAGKWDGRLRLFRWPTRAFPTGLVEMVRRGAEKAGLVVEVEDPRQGVKQTPCDTSWLDPAREQPQVVDACLANTRGVIWAPTGCLTGDTKLVINRGGGARLLELRAVVGRLQGEATKNRAGKLCAWDLNIPTFAQSLDAEGNIRLNRIEQSHRNGRQRVIQVVTESGRHIRATAAHRFWSADKAWVRLADLREGDHVMLATWAKNLDRQRKLKTIYAQVGRMHGHPYARQNVSGRGEQILRVPLHRLVAEARENKMSLYELVGRIHLGEIDGLKFLGPEWHVHHRDGNHLNNTADNLAVLTGEEHLRLHGKNDGWKNCAGYVVPERIREIVDDGEDDVFDLSMADPMNNYVANEFVTHNSGKTECFIALGRRVPCRWLVFVHKRDLLHQTAERFEKRTGERAGRVGDSIWEPARWTVATFQTIFANRTENKARELLLGAEGVIADECFPAGTAVDGRPIEQVRVGDTVMSFDSAGQLTARRVVRVMSRVPTGLVRVRFADGRALHCTPNHKLWTRTGWQTAGEIPCGCDVLCLSYQHANSNLGMRGMQDTRADEGPEEGGATCWVRVDSVEVLESGGDGKFGGVCPDGRVYNLEVEETHCYFANGVGVSNCHVAPASTFSSVLRATPNAYWRFGFSGTPLQRGDCRNVMLIAATGPVIHRVMASDLVDAGVLSRPKIKFVTVEQTVSGQDWRDVYTKGVVESPRRNSVVAAVTSLAAKPALVFVREISHGRTLLQHIKNAGLRAEFVWGEDSSAERRAAIKRLRFGDIDVLVTSSIFDAGVDIPEVASVIIAAGGKSAIEALQRLGRGMRIAEGKREVELWDVNDSGNVWLKRHAQARLATYSAEGFEVVVMQESDLRLQKQCVLKIA